MIDKKTVLAIIPARGGSKRLPDKNIRILKGKPLIAWTIETAKMSKFIDRLILSTEDPQIINLAKKWGCDIPFVRPHELATDDTLSMEVILHAIDTLKCRYDYIVYLQPTSPLRTPTDIDACIRLCRQRNAPACVSVKEPDKPPFWMYTVDETCHMTPFVDNSITSDNREDLPAVYVLNGAVYVAETLWLLKQKDFISPDTIAYIMPKERSYDIDSEIDLRVCEYLLSR